ncbi:MAG TPA: hypothetical protein VG711_03740 [Phycisphaerales bacterium]|nr:hypothetical protein [Phycisphaerales bacterium]
MLSISSQFSISFKTFARTGLTGCGLIAGLVCFGCASQSGHVSVGSGVQLSLGAFSDPPFNSDEQASAIATKKMNRGDYNEGGIAIDDAGAAKGGAFQLGAGDGLGIMIFDPMGNVQALARANDPSPVE